MSLRAAAAVNRCNTSSSSPRGSKVEANRWSIADEHTERGLRSAGEFRLGGLYSLVPTGALEIHYFEETFSTPGRGPGINPPGDVPVPDTAERGAMKSASAAGESNVRSW